MSLQQPQKLTEAKAKSKFQSLNINNIYQGATNKNSSKGPPQKHGLQSLGKVPTARKAPANLPSVKSEKGGNDPTVVLVPSGGSGWTKDGQKAGSVEKEHQNSAPKPEAKEVQPPVTSSKSSPGVKSWSSVTGAGQSRTPAYGQQKHFGQEFPSLKSGEVGEPPVGETEKLGNQAARLQLEPQTGREDYGPNLRPQTYGNWTQGGIKGPGTADNDLDSDPIVPPQPHKPTPPGGPSGTNKPTTHPSSTQYNSIMPPFMDAMILPAGPPEGIGARRISRDRSGPPRREPQSRGRKTEFAPPSIIDKEKLKRMDELAGDDWTYDDNDFDYNKRLQSDDDEPEQDRPAQRPDSNWADQVEKVETSHPYNFYQDIKKPGFGVDEDEKRRNKKSEEVMKNIERARQRREEEENRYRRPNSEEKFKSDDRPSGYRLDDRMKENKTPTSDRKEWAFEEKRGPPRLMDDRRDARFDERNDRDYDHRGYNPQRFERKDEYRNFDDSSFEDDFKQFHARKTQVRSFDDCERVRGSEENPPFTDLTASDENRVDRRWNERSPIYNHPSSVADSPSELENGTSEWGLRPGKSSSDWAEDVENEAESSNIINRSNPKEAKFVKEARAAKEDRSYRGSVEKTKKDFVEEKPPAKSINPLMDFDHDKKSHKKAAAAPDLRGYFRDQPEEPKKVARAAPGPITREKLEAADHRENTGMTQLTKRDAKTSANKPADNEVPEKLNPLIDADLLENISEDEDGLLETLEREEKAISGRGGRGRGRGGLAVQDNKKFQSSGRGGRGAGERGGRGGRGGRGEPRGRGHGRFGEMDYFGEESEEARKNRKNYDNFNQPPPGAFMPRGQPSRRGRGEGKPRGNMGRVGSTRHGEEDHLDEIGEWNDNDYGRAGKIPPRMQRKRDEKRSLHPEGDAEMEEWDSNSEHSNEERRRREAERGRGRGGRGWDSRGGGGRRGGMHGFDNREQTPENEGMKKRSGILDNLDINDFSGVGIDQDKANMEQEFDKDTGEFMQVVNRKGRPQQMSQPANREDRRSFERTGPKVGDKGGYDKYRDQRENFNKQNKTSYERRQNKLPPRLAKVREVSRAQARSGGVSPSGMEQNGWPEGDKMGVFQVEDLGTNAWEKPSSRRDKEGGPDGPDLRASPKTGKENGGIQQTMVFENTALKGGKGDKGAMDKSAIQLPVGLGKPEENMDMKIDFFGGEDLSGQGKPQMTIPRSMPHLSSSQGLPASPSTDDLSAKLANTKKLWDSPGMPAVPENPAAVPASWNDGSTFNENPGFDGFQDPGAQNVESNVGYDKSEGGQPGGQAPKIKHPHHQQLQMDQENRQNNPMQFSRNMPGAIPSPPTQMNQMGTMQPQPWGFPMDRTSTIYNPYGASQLLMQGTHSIGTDLFTGSNGAGGYRLQGGGHYPGSQQSTTNNVLISQANLINSGVKHTNQIGPIGTKAGNGANASPYLQSGLGTLPNTFIQYEPNSFNYVNPNAAGLQRGNAPPTQTAFYQTLASRQPQLAALNAAMPGSYNHAMSQQQIRANHVAGLPFIKSELPGLNNQKSGLGENFNNSYNGRSNGPPSPKTKLKIEQQQQQQQAKMAAAGMNNLTQLAQLRMSSLGYNIGIPGVTPGYPSPIARPPMNQGNGNPGHPTKVDYYMPEVGGDGKVESGLEKGGDGAKEAEAGAGEAEHAEQETSES